MNELSRHQQGRIDEERWLDGVDALSGMRNLKERIDQEYGGDLFKIPQAELRSYKAAADAYLANAKGKDRRLDQLAQNIHDLPDQKSPETTEIK